MRELTVTEKDCSQRLDKYLAKYLSAAPKSFLYKMMRKKNIVLNKKKASGSERLCAGDVIGLFLSDETIEKFRGNMPVPVLSGRKTSIRVVYEDEHVIFLDKPSGMLSQKASPEDVSLSEHLAAYLAENGEYGNGTFRPGLCNRLDRNTSGLVLAGKTVAASQELSRLIAEREVGKYYLTLVKGKITGENRICGFLQKDGRTNTVHVSEMPGKDCVRIETAYRPLAVKDSMTLLRVELITGKSHQIRSHLASIGHPVAGDPKYGDEVFNRTFREQYGLQHQLLHAWFFTFPEFTGTLSYLSGQKITAPVPKLFQKIIDTESLTGDWSKDE